MDDTIVKSVLASTAPYIEKAKQEQLLQEYKEVSITSLVSKVDNCTARTLLCTPYLILRGKLQAAVAVFRYEIEVKGMPQRKVSKVYHQIVKCIDASFVVTILYTKISPYSCIADFSL